MLGLSRDKPALYRFVTITPHPHLVSNVETNLDRFPKDASRSHERNELYQLSGDFSLRMNEHALQIRKSIEQHCGGNPFCVNTPLKNLMTSALVAEEAKSDILNYAQKGQITYGKFVSERIVSTSRSSLWDRMKKLKLKP